MGSIKLILIIFIGGPEGLCAAFL